MHNIITKKQAKRKTCPFIVKDGDSIKCLADQCIGWVWEEKNKRGYCAMIKE